MTKETENEWVNSNKEEIKRKYMNKWIAVGDDGLIDSGEDLGDLMKSIEDRGTDIENVIFMYVNSSFGRK